MTEEENKKRSVDPKVNFIKRHICDHDGEKSYVFISYKSDDWRVVLTDIVYRLVTEYGLNIYFDGSFDMHNALWVEQFPIVINLLCGGSESMPREVLKNNLRIVGGTDDSSIKKGIGEII